MKHKITISIKWLLKNIAATILAVLILFQEWGWEPLKKLVFLLTRGPFWQKIRAWISQRSPYGALTCFVFPLIIEKLVELLGFLAIFHSHPIYGGILIALSKVIGTALLAWVYQLTEPQLLQIGWFARVHAWWIPWKNELIMTLKQTTFWHTATQMILHSKKIAQPYLLCIKSWVRNLF